MTRAHPPTRARRRRARHLALAVGFFILGIIGVLIPVVPQVPFFIMSALFLSLVFPKVRRALRRFRRRHPKVEHAYRTWRNKARRKRRQRLRQRRERERGVEEEVRLGPDT